MDVSQYLEIFIDETNEHLQNLSDCIMELEKDPENMDTINEIFRAAHSLKGMAGTMGFKRMQHLTHDMENVFQEVRSDKIKVNSSMIDLLIKCLDAIEGYLENVKESSDEGTEDNELIIKELNDFIAAANGGAPAAAAAAPESKPEAQAGEAPAEGSGGYERKYLSVKPDDAETAKIMEATEAGKQIYGFTVYVEKECMLKAARAFLVFKAVEELGQILVYSPSSADIEAEKFESDFSIFVATTEECDKIIEAAKSVSEIEEVVGGEIKEESGEEAPAEDAKETAPAVQEEASDLHAESAAKPQSQGAGGK